MCRFCVEHGEGKRWYLQAGTYAVDLESDLRRRSYIIDFVSGFDSMRSNAITWMERINRLPQPLSRTCKSLVSARQQRSHFGQPVPIEECAEILDIATSTTVIPCICRMHEPGKRADAVCMLVTTQPIESLLVEGFSDYADGPDLDDFNVMSKGEAMTLLRSCEESGLMHSIWTFKTPFAAAICNCNLESGCMAMRLTVGYGMKVMWRGESIARLDDEECSACGVCARLCPFEAIEATRGHVRLHAERCWGCGICRSACPKGALSLRERSLVPEVATLW